MWPSIEDIVKEVHSGEKTAEEQIKKSLERIASTNEEFQAIIAVVEDRALERARKIDNDIKSGAHKGRLSGVPFIAKDNFLAFGAETTAASNMLKGFRAPYQATAIERLEAEGAICVGKANMDAFAHGGSTENSDFMKTRNPHDTTRVPGGSSGGSAAAVALDMASFALGTDTGGSIRQPASFCGIVGYKPTYGLVSRSGVVAMASSTDVIGPMTRNVADTALVVDVMSGKDVFDGTTISRDERSYVDFTADVKGKRVAVIKEHMSDSVDVDVAQSVNQAIEKMKQAGAEVSEVSLPSLSLALAVYYILVPAELSSNLSRHDGQRYEYSAKDVKNLDDSYVRSRSEGFGAEAKRRIMIGTHVLSSGYYDAYYRKAQTVRTKIINEVEAAFKDVDILVGPVTPTTAIKLDERTNNPMQMYLLDIMTVVANLHGGPAVSVPCGFSDKLPIGLQLMAPARNDRELLGFSQAVEELLA